MNFLVLDLEMNQPSGTIIQVGAVVGDLNTGSILESVCHYIYTTEIVDPFITRLTGITQEHLAFHNTHSLTQSYETLRAIREKHQCHRNFVTWGHGDAALLRSQLNYPDAWPFGDRIIDTKTIYIAHALRHDLRIVGGLAKSMTRLGLRFQGTKHNALDDAANTWRMFHKLIKGDAHAS